MRRNPITLTTEYRELAVRVGFDLGRSDSVERSVCAGTVPFRQMR